MQRYDSETEKMMKAYYTSLNEKDRRRYAGLEALKFGRGGRSYIAKVLDVAGKRSAKGLGK